MGEKGIEMGNRVEEGVYCVQCGQVLVDLNPLWMMCSLCQETTQEKITELLKYHKARKGHPDRKIIQTQVDMGNMAGKGKDIILE